MQPHPRIRKAVKWGGAAVTVLLVVVWVGSGWVSARRDTGDRIDMLFRGRVTHEYLSAGFGSFGGTGWWTSGSPRWEFGFDFLHGRGYTRLFVPLWAPALLAACVTGVCWWLDARLRRRERINHCQKCNYDLAGLAGGSGAVCPECGTSV